MKLVSWNVNGIRAGHKKGFVDWFHRTNADIVCLQETKADPDQIPTDIKDMPGYRTYFVSATTKKGYSGVGMLIKDTFDVLYVRYGMGIPRFDDEGRVLYAKVKDITDTKAKPFVLLNVYFPNGGGGPERLAYKMDFYDAFLAFIEDLRKHGETVIFCGDVNTAHEAIDLARPKENEKNTGFLPDERAWLDAVVTHGWVDTFRKFFPTHEGAYSYWDMKTRARDRNVGWRIDYFFVSPEALPLLTKAGIDADTLGSDHCPIWIELKK